jgi:acyl-CoA synthetase (AMP-forming)/AMP-acid ligase II
MSELGIVRVKSEARDSLYMKIGGEGVETRVIDGVLQIRSHSRMMGYLNAESPFDNEGWYDTKDIVEEKDGYYKVVGRTSEVINVGGLKFMAAEVERVALTFPNVSLVKATPRSNPITGQHVELSVQANSNKDIDISSIKKFMREQLPAHMMPKRIIIEEVEVGHRYKRT